jgi:hypothetical protein
MYNLEREIVIGENKVSINDLGYAPGIYYLNIRGATINKTLPILKINK